MRATRGLTAKPGLRHPPARQLEAGVPEDRKPAESDEILPEWFRVDTLPADRMWQDADHWLPVVLEGGRVNIVVTMDNDNEAVASSESLLF